MLLALRTQHKPRNNKTDTKLVHMSGKYVEETNANSKKKKLISNTPTAFHLMNVSQLTCFNYRSYMAYAGAKGVVCGPEGARLADKRVPTKLRKCHLFLPSPIHAYPRHGPWATS